MKRHSSGSRFEKLAAYSRAVVDDGYVHVSGTTGADPATGEMPDSVTEQAANIFRIVGEVFAQHGLGWEDVVRHRVFVTDGAHIGDVADALRARFESCPPANTTLICGIPAPGAKVEIEFTARLRG